MHLIDFRSTLIAQLILIIWRARPLLTTETSSLRSVDETRLKFKTSTETAQNNEIRGGSKEVVEYVMKDELSRVKKMNKEERNSDSELEI
jgi:DUF4097 and DUF4098 domain-containing protein YvlB